MGGRHRPAYCFHLDLGTLKAVDKDGAGNIPCLVKSTDWQRLDPDLLLIVG